MTKQNKQSDSTFTNANYTTEALTLDKLNELYETIKKSTIPFSIVLSDNMPPDKIFTTDQITFYMHTEIGKKIIKAEPFMLSYVKNPELMYAEIENVKMFNFE